ncbi:MAG: aspartate aminotransferase family protein [Candidatus Nanopelagicales bacterium]|nr:aspartate aminotransferase family protein [Candidatus Nanopelagicales bacterium]
MWHPFADMSVVAGHDFVIASGHGAHVKGADGRTYLDATAALWYCNVGHGRVEIADAAAAQMRAIASYSSFGDFATQPTLDLADRLAALSGLAGAKVFFTSGGSDAVDTALKMISRYWALLGEPKRTRIIARHRSYHGMHVAGTSLGGISANRDGHGEPDPKIQNVTWDDAEVLALEIDAIGAENVAAFFCEPVIGAGGVYPPPDGYLTRVRDICKERGVLLVADEVISGYGRTGSMFASQRWDMQPDLILTAKGLTSGYLPMGAVLVSGRVAEPFWNTPGLIWRHGYTYSGHATAAVVANVNLDIIEREQLVERVDELAPVLSAALNPLATHSHVEAVRTVGLLGAVQLRPDVIKEDPAIGARLVRAARDRGVLTRLLADGGLQVSPPFVVTREDLHSMGRVFDEALGSVGSTRVKPDQLHVDLLPDTTTDESGGFDSSDARLRADVPPHHGT